VAPGAVDAERAVELMRLAGDLWGLADALMWAQIHSFFGGRRKDAESLHDELESLSNCPTNSAMSSQRGVAAPTSFTTRYWTVI